MEANHVSCSTTRSCKSELCPRTLFSPYLSWRAQGSIHHLIFMQSGKTITTFRGSRWSGNPTSGLDPISRMWPGLDGVEASTAWNWMVDQFERWEWVWQIFACYYACNWLKTARRRTSEGICQKTGILWFGVGLSIWEVGRGLATTQIKETSLGFIPTSNRTWNELKLVCFETDWQILTDSLHSLFHY